MKFRIFMAATCLFLLFSPSSHAFVLEKLLQNSPVIQKHQSFKLNQSFHCAEEQSYVKIDGMDYEISTFRVVGLEGDTEYKDFADLVEKLNLKNEKSETKVLYQDYPNLKFEMMNIKVTAPKPVQILIALRIIGPAERK